MKTPVYIKQLNKLSIFLLAFLVLAIGISFYALKSNAEEAIYFVNAASGNDSFDGLTDLTPVKTIEKAAALAKSAGYTDVTFILMSENSQSAYYDVSLVIKDGNYKNYNFSFIGKYEGTTYDSSVYIAPDTTFRSNVHFDYVTLTGRSPQGAVTTGFWYLNGYNFYVDEHCETDNASWNYGELGNQGIELKNWPRSSIIAGVNGNGGTNNLPEGSGHTITILSGRFGRVVGVNRGNKYYSGSEGHPFDENIIIGGSAEIALVVGASSEQNKAYSNPNITVNGGYIYRLVGSNFGYPISGSTIFQTHYGDTHITVNGGTIEMLVGSAMGRNTPYVRHIGDTYIDINGGTIGEIQGGGALGDNYGNITINMNGGEVKPLANKYPLQSSAPAPNGNIYGGGSGISDLMNWSDISSGNVTSLGNTFGHVTVNMTGGVVDGTIFGGGHGYDYKNTYGSDKFFNIAQVMNGTEVNISGSAHVTGDVYGGGDGFEVSSLIAKVSPETSVSVRPDAVIIDGDVYGGGNHGLVDGNTTVSLAQGTVLNNVYGAASNSPVTGNVTLIVEENTKISGNLYGGGANGSVGGNVNITIDENVKIAGSVYGGGENGDIAGKVDIQIGDSSVIGNIYGGGEHGNIGEGTTITIGNNTTVSGSIHGGGANGNVGGDTAIHIKEGAIIGDIYGGGDNGKVDGSTIITIEENTTVNGDIYGGGKSGSIGGDTSIEIGTGSHVDGTIFGGGDSGNVNGDISITINPNTEVGTIIGGCNSGEVGGNTNINVTGPVTFSPTIGDIAVAGGGLNGKTDGNVTISLSDVTINGNVYDGGVGSDAVVNGNVEIDIDDVTMPADKYFYVGGGSGSVYGDINIDKDESDISFKVSNENSERPSDSFDGWKIESSGSGGDEHTIKSSGETFKLDAGQYDMTINWTGTVVTLIFHSNGHGSGTMINQKIIINFDTSIRACNFVSRFFFKGWALDINASSADYTDKGTIRFSTADLHDLSYDADLGYYVDLYAIWDDPRTETVIKIPKVIIVDGIEKKGSYSVEAQSDSKTLEWTVIISPDASITMHSLNKSDVVGTITQTKEEWDIGVDTTTTEINSGVRATGVISAPTLSAGQWYGTFNFHIEVVLDEDKPGSGS